MRSPVAVAGMVAVWVRPAWVARPWAVEHQRDRSAAALLRDLWEVERQAPAVQAAMEQLERVTPV
jgi:hypothetical protein